MIFPSLKQFRDADDFVEQFIQTIDIETTSLNYRNSNFQAGMKSATMYQLKRMTPDTFFSKTVISYNAFNIIDLGFRLLGFDEWSWNFHQESSIHILKRLVKAQDKSTINLLCNTLVELGLFKLIEEHNIDDILLGIYLAKNSHIRNERVINSQFIKQIDNFLDGLLSDTNIKIRRSITIYDKNFEFGLVIRKKLRFLIDVNYYVVSGSKPTLISRDYGLLQYRLSFENIGLIWITDGSGYFNMKSSLKQAYKILPNIYNLHQLKDNFEDDIKEYL